jgi:hypothetical protein
MNKVCVHTRITVRKIQKHPLYKKTLRTGTLVGKHAIRGATVSLLPDAINDFGIHHAPINAPEFIHVVSDHISITTLSFIMTSLMFVVKKQLD